MTFEPRPIDQAPTSDLDRMFVLAEGTEAERSALQKEVTPHMTREELAFCRTSFLRLKRIPCRGELRLLDLVAANHHKEAQGLRIDALRCEDAFVAETYQDLLDKHTALHSTEKAALTLRQAASVSRDYLHMIGRGTDLPSLWSAQPDPSAATAAAFVLLLPQAEETDYPARLEALVAEAALQSLAPLRIRVSPFGLLATLSEYASGLMGELSPSEDPATLFSLLGDAHVGREIWNLPRNTLDPLCRLAQEQGLRVALVVRRTDGEDFILRDTATGARRLLSLSVLRGLRDLPFSGEITLTKESETLLSPRSPIEESLQTIPFPSLPPHSLLCAARREEAVKDCFSLGIRFCLDPLLHLLCRGVNRRAVGFSLSYTFPKDSEAERRKGQNLALLLGVYRFTVELASPQTPPLVSFSGDVRSVNCTAFASRPTDPLPAFGGEPGDTLYYLPVCEDGFPDFARIRSACDRFTALLASGSLHSARPVWGDPTEALTAREHPLAPKEALARSYGAGGILFASSQPQDLPQIARLS